MAVALFWLCASTVAYSYAGFPALVLARAALRPRPWRPTQPGVLSVSVVVAAHDEAAAIGNKVHNVLGQVVPGELECIVVSDGSSDSTVEVARAAGDHRVTVIEAPRVGKAGALDLGIAAARHDVVVFTDANSELRAGAIAALVAPFADPDVGGVAGDQRYAGGGDDAEGERRYWDLDRLLKRAESRAGNVISATGALYAIRRELIDRVPEGVTDDFAISTAVIERGRRLVFAEDAVAFEPPAEAMSGEYRRKVRIMTRGLRGVLLRRALLDPRRSGFYAVQLLSHKVLRRLSAVPLLASVVLATRLRRRPFFRCVAAAQRAGGATVLTAMALSRTRAGRNRAVSILGYYGMVNTASLHALLNLVTGRRIDRWTPQRTGTERR